MFDSELFKRIINCELTFEELEAFFQLNKMKYDLDNSFDKYFSFEKIQHAYDLYRSHKINDRYLADWACIYDQILMATILNTKKSVFDFKRNIIEHISEWLGNLSYFDENEGGEELNDEELKNSNIAEIEWYYENLLFYSTIYENLSEWTAYYAKSHFDVEEHNENCILCVNHKDKTYFTMDGLIDKKGITKECYLNDKQWISKKVELKASGYQRIFAQ